MSDDKNDLRSLIQRQLEEREGRRQKVERLPSLKKPGSGPRPAEETPPPSTPEQRPRPVPAPRADGYRFLNPYNFCRYLEEPESEAIEASAETRLLWRCEPPPHLAHVVV